MRGKLFEAISRRNFLKGSSVAAAAAAIPAGMVRSLPAEAADPSNPFPHGVASGDPLTDRVMLWTRLNPDFVEATAKPGQAGVRGKPRCKGCKVESAPSTSTGRPGCKGCKVERDPSATARVQTAGLVWEVVTFGELATPDPLTMTDEQFDSGLLVASGSASATVANDYTVKIDAGGLVAGTYYYYRFSHGGVTSDIARTKTLPANPTTAKIALVSCSSIPHGYFNAYGALAGLGGANFDDVDVVLCLGDYIYEYAQGCYPEGDPARPEGSSPQTEMITLSEYRTRHRQYKLDSDLQVLHRKFPMINVWDDHETADNSYPNGAVNHTAGAPGSSPAAPVETDPASENWAAEHCNESGGGRVEGDWLSRVANSKRAYFEYLPVRPDPSDPFRLYRTFSFGGLADLIMLDTRLQREGPGCATTDDPAEGAEACGMDDLETINHPDRYLLGRQQLEWLDGELQGSTAKWQILGQQIMVGQLRVAPNVIADAGITELAGLPGFDPTGTGIIDSEGVIFITDLWDGWQASRDRLYELIKTKNENTDNPGNVVILTGDIHTSWAHDIHPNPYNVAEYNFASGEGSLAVEFVCPSTTSMGLPELAPIQDAIRTANPQVTYIDLQKHGFMVLEVTETDVSGTWHNVGDIATPGAYALDDPITLSTDLGLRHFKENCITGPDGSVTCTPRVPIPPLV